MSLFNQQRVRVELNSLGFFAPEQPWEAFCPCCVLVLGAFATWPEATARALEHLRRDHCRFCIERNMPAGRDPVLGELFERCPVCTDECPGCDGIAVHPIAYATFADLVDDLASINLTPIFCEDCHGVVAVLPLDPEVYA
ncbi:hypothetical protein AB0G04_24365 [Actinoplanes sp. NPDC023801]|uniref:hypothetical protein n=1 Tax=Actinoplanes sp. NPDC023801 TaxID=3154595 RepID=UPI0033E3EDDD